MIQGACEFLAFPFVAPLRQKRGTEEIAQGGRGGEESSDRATFLTYPTRYCLRIPLLEQILTHNFLSQTRKRGSSPAGSP